MFRSFCSVYTGVSHSDTGFCYDLCRQLHVYKYRVVNQLMLWSIMILDLPMLFSFVCSVALRAAVVALEFELKISHPMLEF
jgi:hypothetical protein